MDEIVKGLFDLSFRKYVTPKMAKVIFILGIVGAALQALMVLKFLGSFGIIAAPICFLITVVFLRTFIELTLAIFQIARYSQEVARRGRGIQDKDSNDFRDSPTQAESVNES